MKKLFSWSQWSIATKILIPFLSLTIISIGIIGYVALVYITALGNHALETSTSLGETAIEDSTSALNKLGEDSITQKAQDIAKQVEVYLNARPVMTLDEMRGDTRLRDMVVQPVGKTGYTTLLDSNNFLIVIHKFPEQEKNLTSLKETLPTFWSVLEFSGGGKASSGYYDWQEVDGSIRKKFASIIPINYYGEKLTLWATTYIDEFSKPAEDTKQGINAAITASSNFIYSNESAMQNTFIIIFTILICVVTGLALILAWFITSPITALKQGAEAIGQGNLDYQLNVTGKDELGDLANSFNMMALAMKNNLETLNSTASENLAKEKTIQDNLHLYVHKVSQAQEAERKRVARELHDETAQALVVVLRHLDDLATGNSKVSAGEIREEVRKILEGVRRFSQELRPSILDDLGLIPAVKWLASDLTQNYGIKVDTVITGNPIHLPQESELLLFRIIQEALTNVRKHSKAVQASIQIDFSDQKVKVSIWDNGKGFNKPSRVGDLTRTGKLGLVGIQERVQLLGGSLNIQSQPGNGTTLVIEVPVKS